MQKPNLSPTIFWDIDFSKIDYDGKYRFVIERVLERGDINDWNEIKRYYGLGKMKDALLQARYLSKENLSFSSVYFDVAKENFRCYKLQSSNPGHWHI
jgi:hypothetical protein